MESAYAWLIEDNSGPMPRYIGEGEYPQSLTLTFDPWKAHWFILKEDAEKARDEWQRSSPCTWKVIEHAFLSGDTKLSEGNPGVRET